jgi:hypothetical protein
MSQPPEAPPPAPVTSDAEISDEDFSHVAEAFFGTPDHGYTGAAIELSFDIEPEELNSDLSVRDIVKECTISGRKTSNIHVMIDGKTLFIDIKYILH